jgi:hypothetical protein
MPRGVLAVPKDVPDELYTILLAFAPAPKFQVPPLVVPMVALPLRKLPPVDPATGTISAYPQAHSASARLASKTDLFIRSSSDN